MDVGRRTRCPRRDGGASTVEYALLALAIAAVLVAVVIAFSDVVRTAFRSGDDCATGAGTTTSCPVRT